MKVVSLYRFLDVQDPETFRDQLKTICDQQGLLGTVLVATEGFNGTLAGSEESILAVMNWIRERFGIDEELDARWTEASEAPFRKMRVKVKPEIVTLGRPDILPHQRTGVHVDAARWNELIADPDVLLVGDFNAYAKEDPIAAVTASGYEDLIARRLGTGGYSYIFEGQSGYLDHALASPELADQVSSAVEWHINADEPRFLDYNLEFNPPNLLQPNAFRSSDHDPLVVGLELGARSCRSR